MSIHAKFWLGWTAIGLIYELVWILLRKPQGTLSWQIWGLRTANVRLFSAIMFLILWALYHFRYETAQGGEGIRSFGFFVVAWAFFTYIIDPLTPPPVPVEVPHEQIVVDLTGEPPPASR